MGSSSGMMEASIIALPYLEDDKHFFSLGQLWNCRTNKFAGVNLFDESALSKEFVAAHPVQSSTYELSYCSGSTSKKELLHVAASISIELCGGSIKVGGAASFDNSSTDTFDQEQLFCSNEITTFILKFYPNISKSINKEIQEKIIDGKIEATHYVGEIKIGAHLLGSLMYRKTLSDSLLAISASVEGKMLVGPVSIGLKASFEMLDSESVSGYSKSINLESRPALNIGFEEEELSSKRMFELIESFELTEPYQGGLYGENIRGVPLSIKLIPVTQLFDPGQTPLYKLMEEDVLNSFSDMILTLHDFTETNHIKSLIRSKDPRLAVLFINEDSVSDMNPLAEEIHKYDIQIQELAKSMKSRALEDFEKYKIGEAEITKIVQHIENYMSEFDLSNVQAKIEDYYNQGESILNTIHVEDAIIANSMKLYVKTNQELGDWFEIEDDTIKLLLNTSGQAPDGVFLKIFTIIPYISQTLKIHTRITYPNIVDKFSLIIKYNHEKMEYMGENIFFILECLSVFARAEPNSVKTLFYDGFAENLSLSKEPDELNENPVLTLFPLLNIFLNSGINQVKVCESYPELRDILTTETDEERVLLVFPFQTPYSAWEVLSTFNSARNMLKENTKVKSVIGYLQNNEPESPLVYIFKKDKLLSVCMNKLDVAICLEYLNSTTNKNGFENIANVFLSLPTSPTFSNQDWIYHHKSNFAQKTNDYLSPNPTPSINTVNLPQSLLPVKEFPFHEILDALEIIKASISRNVLEITTVLSFLCIRSYPSLITIFQNEKYFWDVDHGFRKILDFGEWESLKTDLCFFIEEYITKPREILDNSHKAMNEFEPGDGISEWEKIVTPLFKIKAKKYEETISSIKTIYDSSATLPDQKERIPKIVSSFILLLDNDNYHFETIFMKILTNLTISEPIDYQQLCEDYIEKITFDETNLELIKHREMILESIQDKKYRKALYLLARVREYNPRLFKIYQYFNNLIIEDLKVADTKIMKLFLELIGDDQAFANEKSLIKALFQNTKIRYWLSFGLNDDTLIEMIWSRFCKNEGRIPYYMSAELSARLNKFVFEQEEADFIYEYPKHWENLNDVIQAFQIIVTRGLVPLDFLSTFRINLASSLTLRQQLKASCGLFYWNENELLFEEAWSIETIEKSLNLFMQHQTSKKLDNKNPLIMKQNKNSNTATVSVQNIRVNQIWKPFTGGMLEIFHENKISSVRTNLCQPFVSMTNLSGTMSLILPYVVQELQRINTNVLHPSNVVNFIDYLSDSWKPGQIPSDERSGSSKGRDVHLNPFLMTRSDIITAIFNSSDSLVLNTLVQALSMKSQSLPLILPYIALDSNLQQRKYNMFSSYLQFAGTPASEIPRRFLEKPNRFLIAVRIGSSSIGKSTILNQILFKEKSTFSSKAEQGTEYGKPIQRNGFVELTCLTENTVENLVWEDYVLSSLQKSTTLTLAHLANIHGDILTLDPEILEVLKPYVSCYIVFWTVNTWNDMKAKQKLLRTKIGVGTGIVHIVINPNDDTLRSKVGDQNILNTNELSLTSSKRKLGNIIQNALTYKQNSYQPRLSSGGVIHVLKGISTPESSRLIEFIANNTVEVIKAKLLNCTNEDQLAKEALDLYSQIIMISSLEIRKAALTHFALDLSYLSAQSSIKALEKVLLLENNNLFDSSYEIDMKQALRIMDSLRLSPDNFFNTLIRLNSAGISENLLFNFAELFNSGFPLQLFSKDDMEKGNESSSLFSQFGESLFSFNPKRKIYVLSTIGLRSSYKSSLLNSLFGKQTLKEGKGGCTNGIVFQLFHLEENLQKHLGIDSIMVLDPEGICARENRNAENVKINERKLVTFLLGVSHCVIVNMIGTVFTDLKSVLEISLLNQCKLDNRQVIPDLFFVCHEIKNESTENLQNSIINSANQIISSIYQHPFELGLRNGYIDNLANIGRRLLAHEFVFPIHPKATMNAEYFKDIKTIWNELVETILITGTSIEMSEWYDYAKICWTTLACNNNDSQLKLEQCIDINEVQLKLSIQTQMDAFKNFTNRAIRSHFKFLEANISPDKVEETLEIIEQNVRQIPNFCTLEPLETSCENCKSVMDSKQNLFKLINKTIYEISFVSKAQDYLKQARQSLKSTLLQMLIALQIEVENSEELSNELKCILETTPDISSAWIKFKQYVSDKQSTISALQGIENELIIKFNEFPEFLDKLPITGHQETVKFTSLEAINIQDYLEIPLGPINLSLSGILNWEEATYLEVQLLDLPEKLLGELGGHRKYQIGMGNEVIQKVDEILTDFELKFGWELVENFKNEVKFSSLLIFYWNLKSHEEIYDLKFNPIEQLLKKFKKFPDIFNAQE